MYTCVLLIFFTFRFGALFVESPLLPFHLILHIVAAFFVFLFGFLFFSCALLLLCRVFVACIYVFCVLLVMLDLK